MNYEKWPKWSETDDVGKAFYIGDEKWPKWSETDDVGKAFYIGVVVLLVILLFA